MAMTSKNRLSGMNLARDSRRAVSPVTVQLRNETQKNKIILQIPKTLGTSTTRSGDLCR